MPRMARVSSFFHRYWVPIALTGLALIGILIWYGPTDNWTWDPSFYYAQLRSPIIENDLDFRNETITTRIEMPTTATGLQGSPWPVRPARESYVNFTTILPTFCPWKRPMNAPTAWSIPGTTVSLCFTLPALK